MSSRSMRDRALTYNERATYGECPVCSAKHGERCDPNVGVPWGMNAPENGVHLGRLSSAPTRVREVPY